MLRNFGSGVAVALALVWAGASTPARAEVTASDVLTWCDGATQPGQLGAINAFRCVNYLQGAADMAEAIGGADLARCLDGGQSIGAQLMARFVPILKGRAAEGAINDAPVARQVADWLANECGGALTVADAEHIQLVPPTAPDDDHAAGPEIEPLRVALAEARADADAQAAQVADLQDALEVAVTGQSDELAACTASMDLATSALATAEAEAADNGMQRAELELELAAVNAEAIARRQEIASAEQRIGDLTTEMNAALSAQIVAEEALARTTREASRLAAIVDEARSAADAARRAAAEAEERAGIADASIRHADERVAAAEQQVAAADARLAEVRAELAARIETVRGLEADLARSAALAADRGVEIGALENDLGACRVTIASANTPSVAIPPQTPERTTAPPQPNIVASPTPSQSIFGSDPGTPATPRSLDALGLQALRQMQQVVLRAGGVGTRQEWTGPRGRYSGAVEVLQQGYVGPDLCREINSQVRSDAGAIHQATELYCERNGIWVFVSGT